MLSQNRQWRLTLHLVVGWWAGQIIKSLESNYRLQFSEFRALLLIWNLLVTTRRKCLEQRKAQRTKEVRNFGGHAVVLRAGCLVLKGAGTLTI